ncbi:restriction endonuclease subunit S [Methylibium rhizosphaerae]|uniref:restriction endonuclease subunit S n=1 Tax=Methylibium rhizosphaerae TaxID=2570323 RepID=UPI0015E428A5|nr:restriction endonuclease subunit S [Methylibium rhizosphaerae]
MSDWPSTWETTTIGAVIELNPKTTDLADTTLVGFVPMALLGKSYLDGFAFQPRPWAEVKRGYSHFCDGDVLLAKITPCFENGKAGLARGLPNRMGAGSTEYFVCRPRTGVIDARYLLAFLKTEEFVREGATHMTGSVGHKRVPKEYLSERVLPLPPLKEQTRIADQLNTLLARIQACNDRLDAIPALLKRFRQAVLDAATFGVLTEEWRDRQVGLPPAVELRHAIEADHVTAGGHERGNASDPTEEAHDLSIDQLPEGWTISRLRDCCRPGRPITYGILKPGPELSEGVPYIRVADFPGNRLNLDSIKRTASEIDLQYKRARLMSGDLLLSIRGSVGRLIVIPPELEGANITQDTARLSITSRLNARYVYYALLSPDAQRRMTKAVRGVAVRGINIGDVRALQIPLPSLPEQEEIVRQVDRLFLLAGQIEAHWNAMRRHAQRLAPQLLSKAFRGELVQQDPNDEPASVLLQRLAKTPTAAVKAPRGRPRSKQANPSAPLPTTQPDWAALPSGAWAASAQPDEHATTALLIAVLKAWSEPMPQDQARLAAMLCLQPRLFTAVLPTNESASWRRLVGAEAEPLPASVATLQPSVNTHWRRALSGLRARGDLVASGSGPQDTWALGPGADRVDTAGWPGGRAGWVVAYLRAHGAEAVLPLLPAAAGDFVHARAA